MAEHLFPLLILDTCIVDQNEKRFQDGTITGETLRRSSLPTSGYFQKGARILHTNPAIYEAVPNQYALVGWMRLSVGGRGTLVWHASRRFALGRIWSGIHLYPSDQMASGEPDKEPPIQVCANYCTPTMAVPADWNGDGEDDLIVSDRHGFLYLFERRRSYPNVFRLCRYHKRQPDRASAEYSIRQPELPGRQYRRICRSPFFQLRLSDGVSERVRLQDGSDSLSESINGPPDWTLRPEAYSRVFTMTKNVS
jgi:hypothetical protein